MLNISLRQLQAIKVIRDTGKITNAAKQLGLTGPAVTLQLKQVEDMLGISLFDRTNEGMRLTAAGAAALACADEIAESLLTLQETVAALKGVRVGTLRLGAVSTAKYFVPRMIAAFLKTHPGIEVNLSIGNREKTIESLRHHQVDIVLMGRPPRDIAVRSAVFGDHPLVIVAPQGHRLAQQHDISKEEMATEKFILREGGSGTRISYELFFGSVPEKLDNPGVVMDSNETIKQAVIAGLGVAFISAHTIEQEVDLGKLVILDVVGMPIRREWFSVSRTDRLETPVMAAFSEFLIRHGPMHLPLISKPYPEATFNLPPKDRNR
ncbi:transcriptional regulator [Rhizobium leguminosarum bv. trifolii WSM2012]|nr:transcriptional regulator [Rhizobium leguminosarum bv. trifolii WSM2012]